MFDAAECGDPDGSSPERGDSGWGDPSWGEADREAALAAALSRGEPDFCTSATALDAFVAPNDMAAFLADTAPGANAEPLYAIDPSRLSDAGLVDLLRATDRHDGANAAVRASALARLAVNAPDAAGESCFVVEEIACISRISRGEAKNRLVVAQELTTRLRDTHAQLAAGVIAPCQAQLLAETVLGVDDEKTAKIEARALRRAGEQSMTNFRRCLRNAVMRIVPVTEEAAHEQAKADRFVRVSAREHGMASLYALLPAEGAAAIMTSLQALTDHPAADDDRSADQRRADALVGWGIAALNDPATPRQQGLRPAVQVTVSLASLLGDSDEPAELTGHGPITAAHARAIAHDPTGTWRRLITDPPGRLIDYGTTKYRPPDRLAQHVIARDRVCTFPHCNRAAHRCELDHAIPHGEGGPTNAENLGPLCKRHHDAKHHGGWHPTREADGTTTWLSPTGHRYRSRPPEYPGASEYPGTEYPGTEYPGAEIPERPKRPPDIDPGQAQARGRPDAPPF